MTFVFVCAGAATSRGKAFRNAKDNFLCSTCRLPWLDDARVEDILRDGPPVKFFKCAHLCHASCFQMLYVTHLQQDTPFCRAPVGDRGLCGKPWLGESYNRCCAQSCINVDLLEVVVRRATEVQMGKDARLRRCIHFFHRECRPTDPFCAECCEGAMEEGVRTGVVQRGSKVTVDGCRWIDLPLLRVVVGDKGAPEMGDQLVKKGITVVVSCGVMPTDRALQFFETQGIRHVHFDMSDDDRQQLDDPDVVRNVLGLNPGDKDCILFHCAAGRNRSVAVMLMWALLIKHHCVTAVHDYLLQEVAGQVEDRKYTGVRDDFMAKLKALERVMLGDCVLCTDRRRGSNRPQQPRITHLDTIDFELCVTNEMVSEQPRRKRPRVYETGKLRVVLYYRMLAFITKAKLRACEHHSPQS